MSVVIDLHLVAHQQAYLGWRQERGEIDVLVSMLGKPPEFVEREHLKFG